jgi:hypothetical protein
VVSSLRRGTSTTAPTSSALYNRNLILCRSAFVWLSSVPLPDALSFKPVVLNDYMSFEPTLASVFFAVYETYYLALEPGAAVSSDVVAYAFTNTDYPQLIYLPEFLFSLSTATSFAHRPNGAKYATALHVFSWIMQFIGHGVFEGRAPAFLDNLAGGKPLASFTRNLIGGIDYPRSFCPCPILRPSRVALQNRIS